MQANKIIDRVRKLYAIAEKAGTPEEAGNALAHAQDLVARHALTEEQIRIARAQEQGDPTDEPVLSQIVYASTGPKIPGWIAILAHAIAESNGVEDVRIYLHGPAAREHGANSDEIRAIKAWGRASDLEIVAELLRLVAAQIDDMCSRSGFEGRTARNNFRLGAAQVVCRRVRDAAGAARKAIEAAAAEQDAKAPASLGASEITAIALRTLDTRIDSARVQREVDIGKTTPGRPVSCRVDHAARDAGKRAGERVAVTRQRAIGGH